MNLTNVFRMYVHNKLKKLYSKQKCRQSNTHIDSKMNVHPNYFLNGYIPVPADNSCFFNAIVQWWVIHKTGGNITLPLSTLEELSFYLRKKMVQAIKLYPNKILWSGESIQTMIRKEEKIPLKQYCKRMENRNEWAGPIEVEVTSLLLQVNIITYQLNPESKMLEAKMISKIPNATHTIYLLLNGWKQKKSSHYSLLIRKNRKIKRIPILK